ARPAHTPRDTTTTGVRVDHEFTRACMWRHAQYGLSNTGPAIGRSKALSLSGVWEMVGVRAGAAPAPVPQAGTGADRLQRETCNARRVPFHTCESTGWSHRRGTAGPTYRRRRAPWRPISLVYVGRNLGGRLG